MEKAPLFSRRISRPLVLSLALSAAACGHSESEWQAQLKKYEDLAREKQELESEFEAAREKVQQLAAELESLGFKLTETGAEKDKLLSALQEYKERAAALERIKARFESLRKKLEELTKLGLKIDIRKNRMVISLPGDVLFASGKDTLQKEGTDILGKVAKVIREDQDLAKRTYQVAGHTDNQPIKSVATTREFKDNWGLSLMRARQVLLFLIAPVGDEKSPGGGLDSKLWSASGYGDTDPIANNGGKFGRERNRRVELIMMPNVEEMLDLKSLVGDPVTEDLETEEEAEGATKGGDAKPADAKPADAKPADDKTEAPKPPAKS